MKLLILKSIALLSSAAAFAPSTGFIQKSSPLKAEATVDTNFEGIDLAGLLGAKRLSNIKRKVKREQNSEKDS